jgi:hypothetical protein
VLNPMLIIESEKTDYSADHWHKIRRRDNFSPQQHTRRSTNNTTRYHKVLNLMLIIVETTAYRMGTAHNVCLKSRELSNDN